MILKTRTGPLYRRQITKNIVPSFAAYRSLNSGNDSLPLISHSSTKATLIAVVCTFFEFCNIPVFWPILLLYFITLFLITMKRQIRKLTPFFISNFSSTFARTTHDQIALPAVDPKLVINAKKTVAKSIQNRDLLIDFSVWDFFRQLPKLRRFIDLFDKNRETISEMDRQTHKTNFASEDNAFENLVNNNENFTDMNDHNEEIRKILRQHSVMHSVSTTYLKKVENTATYNTFANVTILDRHITTKSQFNRKNLFEKVKKIELVQWELIISPDPITKDIYVKWEGKRTKVIRQIKSDQI
ncbi:retention in endoplasmic reticulum protein 1 [Tyrophagus putrescentiae]|nr:retention in endoplasmic reticulum protein 1 [Tyrophagus putrescentiae]